jgi:uncharacterized repeat protein (TIGR01451 family)
MPCEVGPTVSHLWRGTMINRSGVVRSRRRNHRKTHRRHVRNFVPRWEWLEERLTLSITVTSTGDSGTGSLRAALAAVPSGGTIDFAAGVRNINLTAGLEIATNVTIVNDQGVGSVTIDGGNQVTIFTVDAAVTASLSGLTLTRGSGGFGGAINNAGSLTVQNCSFTNNSAQGNGGAIENNGSLTILNDQFTGNSSLDNGGAIENEVLPSNVTALVTLSISNSTFTTNSCFQTGGAIENDSTYAQSGGDATVKIDHSSFSQNSSLVGGAIYDLFGALSIFQSTFDGNMAEGGGAVLNSSFSPDAMSIVNSTFSNNQATNGSGGGIENTGPLTVIGCTFSGNTAQGGGGGGIENSFGPTTVINSTFSDNSADFFGGGIDNPGADLVVTSSTFSGNSDGEFGGGGIYNQGPLSLNNVLLANNTGGPGPDLFNNTGGSPVGSVTATNTLIGDNSDSGITSGSGNILNGSANLSALGSFGGPTQTFALLTGSDALGHAGAVDTLSGGIGAGDLLITVSNGSIFAASSLPVLTSGYYFAIQIGNEQIQVNGVTLNNDGSADLHVLARNAYGTTAAAHNLGDPVFLPGDQRGLTHEAGSTPDIGAFQTVGTADLGVTIDAIPTAVLNGDQIEFRITVTNLGPDDAQNISLQDSLPAQLSFNSQIDELGSVPFVLSNSGNDIFDTLSFLPAGQSAVVQVFATVRADLANNTAISNTATVSTGSHDTNSSNDSATVHTTSVLGPTLTLNPISGAVAGLPGDTVGWGYTFVNPTPYFAIFDGSQFLLPAFNGAMGHGFGVVPATDFGTYSDYSQFNFVVVSPHSTLTQPFTVSADPISHPPSGIGSFTIDPGASAATPSFSPPGLLVPGQVPGVANGIVELSFNLYSTDPNSASFDPDSEIGGDHFADASASVRIESKADISVTKSDNQHPNAVPGTAITYTVVVTNNGPTDATSAAEVQTIDVQGEPTGTFTLTFNGRTTSVLQDNSPTLASDMGNALTTLSTIGSGNVTVAQAPNSDFFTITFGGTLLGNQPQITANVAGGTIIFANTLTDGSKGTSVVDNFPSTKLQSISWSATPSGGASGFTASGTGNIADFIADLPAGASVTYTATATIAAAATGTLVNTATVAPPNTVLDTTTADKSATITDTLTPQVDLAVSKTGPSSVVAGSGNGNLVYVVTVKNNGPSNASGVTLSESTLLAAGVTFNSTVASAGTSFSGSKGTGTWTVGNLTAGASATLTLALTVTHTAAAGTNVVGDTATVTHVNQTRINTGDDSATLNTSIARSVDLAVSKTGPTTVVAGSGTGNVVYVVTVHNSGPSDASGVKLSEVTTLEPGVAVQSVKASNSTSFSGSNANGTWNVGALASGASATLTITLTVGKSAAAGANIIGDTATLSAVNEGNTNSSNNSASVFTSVTTLADLSITKTAKSSDVQPGGNIQYTVKVSNSGPDDAQNVQLLDTLPAGTTLVSNSQTAGPTFVLSVVSNQIQDTIATLPSGATATFTIVVNLSASTMFGTVISNSAQVTSTTTDSKPSNNTSTATVTANPSGANVVTDPFDGTKTALVVGGTSGSDAITIIPAAHGQVQVIINGKSAGKFTVTGDIFVYGKAGNDTITVDPTITLPAFLFGGDGNDVLVGGGGADVLVGGAGIDALSGGVGRNLLIGGTGADSLTGGNGGDILIGASTLFDSNLQALHSIMAEWTSSRDYGTRTDNLRGNGAGPSNNGTTFLQAGGATPTVLDDGAVDVLVGAGGQDWFFAKLSGSHADSVQDEQADETVESLI